MTPKAIDFDAGFIEFLLIGLNCICDFSETVYGSLLFRDYGRVSLLGIILNYL